MPVCLPDESVSPVQTSLYSPFTFHFHPRCTLGHSIIAFKVAPVTTVHLCLSAQLVGWCYHCLATCELQIVSLCRFVYFKKTNRELLIPLLECSNVFQEDRNTARATIEHAEGATNLLGVDSSWDSAVKNNCESPLKWNKWFDFLWKGQVKPGIRRHNVCHCMLQW